MEFNNILLHNIETHINITFSTPSQIFSYSSEEQSSKDGEQWLSHVKNLKIYIKDKYDEVALDNLRQSIKKKFLPNSLRYQNHHQTILN